MPTASLQEVLQRHTRELLTIPGVTGTGEGVESGVSVIVVFVKERTPELERQLPKSLEGHPVVIRVTGEVTPYAR
jgi:hypothetical protein